MGFDRLDAFMEAALHGTAEQFHIKNMVDLQFVPAGVIQDLFKSFLCPVEAALGLVPKCDSQQAADLAVVTQIVPCGVNAGGQGSVSSF